MNMKRGKQRKQVCLPPQSTPYDAQLPYCRRWRSERRRTPAGGLIAPWTCVSSATTTATIKVHRVKTCNLETMIPFFAFLFLRLRDKRMPLSSFIPVALPKMRRNVAVLSFILQKKRLSSHLFAVDAADKRDFRWNALSTTEINQMIP